MDYSDQNVDRTWIARLA